MGHLAASVRPQWVKLLEMDWTLSSQYDPFEIEKKPTLNTELAAAL